MLPKSPELLFAGAVVVGGAIACGLVLLVGWAALSVLGLAVLAVARRLDRTRPETVPDRPGIAAVIETYAIQLANKRKDVGLPSLARLAHIVRTVGFALLAVGIYMLVRPQL
jgi:hypothetical protein